MNCSNLNEALCQLSEPFYLCTLGLVLALLLFILLLLRRQPKQIVAYKTENGNVTISRLAIVELVRTSSQQIDGINKPVIKIYTRGKHVHLTIYIKFSGDGRLREIEKTLQEYLRQNLSENLGVENLGNINIVITSFKSKKIASPRNTLLKNTDFEAVSEKNNPEQDVPDSEQSNKESK